MNEVVSKSGSMFFDSPPLSFAAARGMAPQQDYRYYEIVNKHGNPTVGQQLLSPRMQFCAPRDDEENKAQVKGSCCAHESKELREVRPKQIFQRWFLPFWAAIENSVINTRNPKTNSIQAAYEGGHRLERREANVLSAFTFGKAVQYDQLDDPNFRRNLVEAMSTKDRKHPKKIDPPARGSKSVTRARSKTRK